MWKYIPFAFKNSLRNKRRTLLTMLSIGLSLFLLSMLIAIYHLFYHAQGPPQEALRLITRHRVSLAFDLPEYYGERMKKVQGVQVVCPETWFGAVTDDRAAKFLCPFCYRSGKDLSGLSRVQDAARAAQSVSERAHGSRSREDPGAEVEFQTWSKNSH